MNFPGRTGQQNRFPVMPGDELNAPRGGQVESAAIGDHAAHRRTAQRQVDRPETIAGPISLDEDASFKE